MLTETLMLVCVLVLMLVTAPLVDCKVVNKPPMGHVRTPPRPVRQEVMVEVVYTVVVERDGDGVVVTTGPSGVT
jgi:hypothetical protein